MMDLNVVKVTISAPALTGSGNIALDRYEYTISVKPKAGGAGVEDRGKGMWIWRRQADKSWMLSYAIWNSDIPIPPAK